MDEENRAKKHNERRELELLTMRKVMSNESGRDFMWRCLQNCCTFESIFNTDATLHTYNSARRDHGLWLESELKEASADNYFLMLKEHCDG